MRDAIQVFLFQLDWLMFMVEGYLERNLRHWKFPICGGAIQKSIFCVLKILFLSNQSNSRKLWICLIKTPLKNVIIARIGKNWLWSKWINLMSENFWFDWRKSASFEINFIKDTKLLFHWLVWIELEIDSCEERGKYCIVGKMDFILLNN